MQGGGKPPCGPHGRTRRAPTRPQGIRMNPQSLEADYGFIKDPGRRRLALHAFTPQVKDRRLPFATGAAPALAQAQHIVFYDFPSSPFCIKVRAMLRHKGLRFSAVDPLQPARWLELQTKAYGKVPTLCIDGRYVPDSTDIAYELDDLFPQRPLLPPTALLRARSHAIEEWADESIYFVALHYLWLHPLSRAQVPGLFGRQWLGAISYRWYLRRIQAQVRSQGTGRKTHLQIERDLLRHLDSAQALLQGAPGAVLPTPAQDPQAPGFLLGTQPWLCDFALFGQLAFLLRARSSRAAVLERPELVDYVDRMRAWVA